MDIFWNKLQEGSTKAEGARSIVQVVNNGTHLQGLQVGCILTMALENCSEGNNVSTLLQARLVASLLG